MQRTSARGDEKPSSVHVPVACPRKCGPKCPAGATLSRWCRRKRRRMRTGRGTAATRDALGARCRPARRYWPCTVPSGPAAGCTGSARRGLDEVRAGRAPQPCAGGTLSEIRAELKGRGRPCIQRYLPVGAEGCQGGWHDRSGLPCIQYRQHWRPLRRSGQGLCRSLPWECVSAVPLRHNGGLCTRFVVCRHEEVHTCTILVSCHVGMLYGVA